MAGKKLDHITCTTDDRALVYVLHGKNGDMLIDTGSIDTEEYVGSWIDRSGFDIKWIFLTHAHFDHAWNAAAFRRKYGAKVILHENDLDLLNGLYLPDTTPTFALPMIDGFQEYYKSRQRRLVPCDIDFLITDNDADFLRPLGFDADIVMLPGHTEGSVGIKYGRIFFCGDACAAKGGDFYTTMHGSVPDQIHISEQKIFDANPLVIAPGHGKLIINEKAFPSGGE